MRSSNGWDVSYFAVKVGARGFPGKSLRFMFKEVGLVSTILKKACVAAGKAAEDASRWLWLKRGDSWKV